MLILILRKGIFLKCVVGTTINAQKLLCVGHIR